MAHSDCMKLGVQVFLCLQIVTSDHKRNDIRNPSLHEVFFLISSLELIARSGSRRSLSSVLRTSITQVTHSRWPTPEMSHSKHHFIRGDGRTASLTRHSSIGFRSRVASLRGNHQPPSPHFPTLLCRNFPLLLLFAHPMNIPPVPSSAMSQGCRT